jgi:hypothetical protein
LGRNEDTPERPTKDRNSNKRLDTDQPSHGRADKMATVQPAPTFCRYCGCCGIRSNKNWYIKSSAAFAIYSGSHSTTQISNAAAAWNIVQDIVSIQQSGFYLDYLISDDDSIEPDTGLSSYTTHATSGCPGQQDSCGYCLDGTMIYKWKIRLNWGGDHGITTVAPLSGITSDQMF